MSDKLQRLRDTLRGCGRVAIAFSGGVDSTFLLAVAHEELDDAAIAVTVCNALNPQRELDAAHAWCQQQGIRHIRIAQDPWDIPGFAENPPDRCYRCKRVLFSRMVTVVEEEDLGVLVDGSNADDLKAYRPGHRALGELGIRSPLEEAGFTKQEIRDCSHELGLSTWDKPTYACLASRFPYGDPLTPEGLSQVEAAEALLAKAGFGQLRVRVHGTLARIEVLPDHLADLVRYSQECDLPSRFRELGFSYVTLDLEGFRSGSLDETLPAASQPV